MIMYLLKEPLRSKFDEQYKGSYKILEILGKNNVKLAISGTRIRIVHVKLKIYKTRPTEPDFTTIRHRHLEDVFFITPSEV